MKRLKKLVFTVDCAKGLGISPRMLSYFTSKGLLRRISHGVYAKEELGDSFDLKSIITRIMVEIPQGAVGRLSALKFYGLLDEDPAFVEVIVPTDNIPKRTVKDAKFFCAPRQSLKQGIEKKEEIRVTTLERTLVECLRTGVSQKLVRSAFEEAQRKGLKPSLSQMERFARLLRVGGKFKLFRESII